MADEVIALQVPDRFDSVGRFYRDFTPVDEAEVLAALRRFAAAPRETDQGTRRPDLPPA